MTRHDADHVTDRLLIWLHGGCTEVAVFDDLREHVWRLGDIDRPLRDALAADLHHVLVQLRQDATSWDEETPDGCAPSGDVRVTHCTATIVCGRHAEHREAWMGTVALYVAQVSARTPARAQAAARERRSA